MSHASGRGVRGGKGAVAIDSDINNKAVATSGPKSNAVNAPSSGVSLVLTRAC